MSRAPDLTSVERSLIESMADGGALPGQPYRTCSRLLDRACSDGRMGRDEAFAAMVALCAVGPLAVPLVDEHGNFGGPGWGPAKPEHVEARLTLAGYVAATQPAARAIVALVNGDEHSGGSRPGRRAAAVLDLVEQHLASTGSGDAQPDGGHDDAQLSAIVADLVAAHRAELSEGGLDLLRTACRPGRRRP